MVGTSRGLAGYCLCRLGAEDIGPQVIARDRAVSGLLDLYGVFRRYRRFIPLKPTPERRLANADTSSKLNLSADDFNCGFKCGFHGRH